jgi:hypothetical protein
MMNSGREDGGKAENGEAFPGSRKNDSPPKQPIRHQKSRNSG